MSGRIDFRSALMHLWGLKNQQLLFSGCDHLLPKFLEKSFFWEVEDEESWPGKGHECKVAEDYSAKTIP